MPWSGLQRILLTGYSLRTVLGVAAIRDFDIIQFDVTSAYLRGTLKEELYME